MTDLPRQVQKLAEQHRQLTVSLSQEIARGGRLERELAAARDRIAEIEDRGSHEVDRELEAALRGALLAETDAAIDRQIEAYFRAAHPHAEPDEGEPRWMRALDVAAERVHERVQAAKKRAWAEQLARRDLTEVA